MAVIDELGKQAAGAPLAGKELDELCVNTIRMLSIDAVQKANSGHPGLPLGCADFAYVLWSKYLKFDPKDPQWPDRERFVLSAGHGSMLLYSMLHLTGYDLSLDDIKSFRQFGSRTPGHPEFKHAPGVDATTGPLGQGVGNAVGMAIAEQFLGATFNEGELRPIDHYTYTLCSDGDLMEGVAAEAISLAGHLGLGKIIAFYDSNHISLEGPTGLSYSDNVRLRFEGYNWHVQEINGMDRAQIANAIEEAQRETGKPSIIIGTTTIGYGSPNKAGTSESHGSPLGEEEVKLTKRNLGWPEDQFFLLPEQALVVFRKAGERGTKKHEEWKAKFGDYQKAAPEKVKLWDFFWSGNLPEGLKEVLPKFEVGKKAGTRKSAAQALDKLMHKIPNLIGGSADLAPSTLTFIKDLGGFTKTNRAGRNFCFGVREHGMGAILNGMCYHGGVRPFGATFFVFCDYMRPSMRLAALSKLNPVYVFTHDSVFLGEDGPTHEPIETLAAVRAIVNMTVIRPADAEECSQAWLAALENMHGPTALVLTRQDVPNLDHAKLGSAEGLHKGAYLLSGEGDITILATGSEVSLALDAQKILKEQHQIPTRVVSMPSFELFDKQPETYRREVLGGAKRVAVEAGIRQGWDRYIGIDGLFIGLDHYGASAPLKQIQQEFGFTPEKVAGRIVEWMKAKN